MYLFTVKRNNLKCGICNYCISITGIIDGLSLYIVIYHLDFTVLFLLPLKIVFLILQSKREIKTDLYWLFTVENEKKNVR